MKKIITTALIFCLALCVCGCSADVNDLIAEGKYDEALEVVEKNPDKYENAPELINDINNQKMAVEIENGYKEMMAEIEEANPDQYNANRDYMDGADFYLRIKDQLDDLNDIIVRDNSLDNAKEGFVAVFGYEPTNVSEAKDVIEELYDSLGFEEFYDSQFFYYQALYSLMWDLTRGSDYVRYEMTDSSGFMIIEQPYQFLNEKQLSAQTFAYLLGVCENMGGQVSRDSERIIVTYEAPNSELYYSRGYYYCAPNSQYETIDKFMQSTNVSLGSWGADEIGVWADTTITTDSEYNIKALSIDAILINADGEHLTTDSILLKNIDDNEITFTLEFDSITMEQLKGKNFNVEFFPAVVMND